MQSSLKKSLYLGLAALSFGAVAATTTNASAKSYAKAGAYTTLKTDATTRNVALTGTNAIYTKPGTVKGAKVVATKTTVANLAKSTSSHKNFRAYGVKTTNRGSVYYKVVSFDKAYRGYIYGGKSTSAFAGGVASYTTFKTGTVTDAQKTGVYKIANAGAKTPVYSQPAYTQYKIGRSLVDTSAYKEATFNIDKVGTRTREGDTWVHIVNTTASDTKANGWIQESALTSTNTIAKDAVRVNLVGADGASFGYVDYTNTGANTAQGTLGKLSDVKGNGNFSWNLSNLTDAKATDLYNQVTDKLKGTGYSLPAGGFTDAQIATLAQAKLGETVTLQLAKGNTVYTQFVPFSRSVSQVTEEAVAMDALGTVNGKANNYYGGLNDLTVKSIKDNSGKEVAVNADLIDDVTFDDAKTTGVYATDTTDLSKAVKATLAKDVNQGSTDLANFNKAIALSAAQLYNAPSDLKVTDLFSGANGANFSSAQALAYLQGNSQLNSLKSAVYPQFDANGNITYKQLTYSPATANAGTFGDVSKAVFSFDLASAKNVAKPAKGTTTTNTDQNPLLPTPKPADVVNPNTTTTN